MCPFSVLYLFCTCGVSYVVAYFADKYWNKLIISRTSLSEIGWSLGTQVVLAAGEVGGPRGGTGKEFRLGFFWISNLRNNFCSFIVARTLHCWKNAKSALEVISPTALFDYCCLIIDFGASYPAPKVLGCQSLYCGIEIAVLRRTLVPRLCLTSSSSSK